jgi:hypothetical protein
MKSFSADDLKPMRLEFAAIANVLILFWLSSLGSAFSQTPAPAALPTSSSLSPDKQWEYKCAEYGLGQCAPEIVKAGTTQVVLDLADLPSGSDAKQAEVVWAPDSKRLAFNYSPPHAHHTTFESVAFYQLRGDKWIALHSPADDIKEGSQLAQPLKEHLPKGFNPRRCTPNRDVLKLRNWTDANTAILYAPCYARASGQLEAAFVFTLRFDDAGKWKIIKTHQVSKKELEEEQ